MTRAPSNRRKLLLLFALLPLLACGILALLFLLPARNHGDEGPVYKGKSLRAWLIQLGMQYGSIPPSQAEVSVAAIGTNALPYLFKWIPQTDYRFPPSSFATRLMYKFPSLYRNDTFRNWARPDTETTLPSGVLIAYQVLGSNAVSAIPALANLANTSTNAVMARFAVEALSNIGAPAWPALAGIVTNQHSRVRPMAMYVPAFRCSPDPDTTLILVKCLNDQDEAVAHFAMMTLRWDATKTNHSEIVIPAFTNLLLNPPPNLRPKSDTEEIAWAADIFHMVRRFGAPSSQAAPAFIQFMKQHPTMPAAATRDLMLDVSIMGDPETVVPFLCGYLHHTNESIREYAAVRLGRQTTSSLPVLTNAMQQATGATQLVISNAIYKVSSDP